MDVFKSIFKIVSSFIMKKIKGINILMDERIIDVLPPYDGEILISWIIRMCKFYTYGCLNDSSKKIMKHLFGPTSSSIPGLYLQKGLKYFVDNCDCDNRLVFGSEKTLLEKLSVLSFYLPFSSENNILNMQNKIDEWPNYIHAETFLGIRREHRYIEEIAYFKFCSECLKEQSEIYLQIEHQIQGNLVCWKHGCVLHRIPYKLSWKEIDFIGKIREDQDISRYDISEANICRTVEISLIVHEIFEIGFKEDLKILKLKIAQKLFDNGIITCKGTFLDLDEFSQKLNADYIYKCTNIKKDIIGAINESNRVHVNPIIYIILIEYLFGDLEKYYNYSLRESERYLLSDSRVQTNKTEETMNDITYYLEEMNIDFWKDYSILGDTRTAVVVRHDRCNSIYTSSKKYKRIRKCRYCKQKDDYFDTEKHLNQTISYQRFVKVEEYSKHVGRKGCMIRRHCNNGRIPGAIRCGVDFLIPIDAPYPKYERMNSTSSI